MNRSAMIVVAALSLGAPAVTAQQPLPQGTPHSVLGTETTRKLEEFPAQATLPFDGQSKVAADFLVRLVSFGREAFVTDNYLVVEIAVFPASKRPYMLRHSDFLLRVNGGKHPLLAQTPGMVAASVRYPDWERQTSATAGMGDAGVILGPAPAQRFPGDRRSPSAQVPTWPRVPDGGTDPSQGQSGEQRISPADVIHQAALPEGLQTSLKSGYLYFYWKGNPAKLKSVELLVSPRAGNTSEAPEIAAAPPLVLKLR